MENFKAKLSAGFANVQIWKPEKVWALWFITEFTNLSTLPSETLMKGLAWKEKNQIMCLKGEIVTKIMWSYIRSWLTLSQRYVSLKGELETRTMWTLQKIFSGLFVQFFRKKISGLTNIFQSFAVSVVRTKRFFSVDETLYF